MADHTLPAIFIITFMGGLISGIICSVVLLMAAGTIMQNVATNALEIVQSVNIDCQEEYVPGASSIKFGEQAYYCTLRIKEKGQDFNTAILPE